MGSWEAVRLAEKHRDSSSMTVWDAPDSLANCKVIVDSVE